MTKAQVLKELTANGYKLVEQSDKLPWQHVLFFERDETWQPPAEKPTSKDQRKVKTTAAATAFDKFAERLIEGLVNRNREPLFVKLKEWERIPLYDEHYDWKEEVRVKAAFDELWEHNSSELWPYLVKHADESRYSFVWVVDLDGEVADKNSVRKCTSLIHARRSDPALHDPQQCRHQDVLFQNERTR